MNELLESYDRLLTILQKMTKSQLEDIGIVRSELTQAIDDNNRLRNLIEVNKQLAEETVIQLDNMKRSRDFFKKMFFGGTAIGVGVGVAAGIIVYNLVK